MAFLLLFLFAGLLRAESPIVRDIQVRGNLRMSDEAITLRLGARRGLPLDEAQLRRDFRKLLDLGLFEEIKIERRDVGDGAVLLLDVREKPFIGEVQFHGLSEPLAARVEARLKAGGAELKPNVPYDKSLALRARRRMLEALEEAGYPFAEVEIRERKLSPAALALDVNIYKGPKIKVGQIEFSGNKSFSSQLLRKQMRLTRGKGLISSLIGRDLYHKPRLQQDIENILLFYRRRGYARAQAGEPRVEVVGMEESDHFPLPFRSKIEKQLVITIPIIEGDIYKFGRLDIAGNRAVADAELAAIAQKIKPGQLYDVARLEEIYHQLRRLYAERGYVAADIDLDQKFDDERKRVDVSFRITEDKPYRVHRIEFKGNFHLPDKILRRELLLKEGETFNQGLLDKSLVRLSQSGLILDLARDDVSIDLNRRDKEVDIIIALKEKERQGFWFTGGANGLGGGYTGIIYTAMNLLGLGEIMSLEATGGPRTSNVVFDLITRNLLGTKVFLGFSLFRRFFNFELFGVNPDPGALATKLARRAIGMSLTGSYHLSENTRFGLSYELESVTSSDIIPASPGGLAARGVKHSFITPRWVYDTTGGLDSPRRGQTISLSSSFSGGLLGGGVNMVRPTLEYKFFAPDPLSNQRNTLAFRALFSHAAGFGGREVPFYERFFGDNYLVRGFDVGELSPIAFFSTGGRPVARAVGGDTLVAFNAEYRMPLSDSVSLNYFFDVGISSLLDRPDLLKGNKGLVLLEATNRLLRTSTGAELQFQLPVVNKPLRLIFALNPTRLSRSFLLPDGKVLKLQERLARFKLGLGRSF